MHINPIVDICEKYDIWLHINPIVDICEKYGIWLHINPIVDICEKYGIWLHVDAAWGGGLLMSNRYRHAGFEGIER